MSVWLVLPSKRSPEEVAPVFAKWREMGYKIAIWTEEIPKLSPMPDDYISGGSNYPGYAHAVNALAEQVLEQDRSCDWVVAAGDDTLPDPNKRAEEIARECLNHFEGRHQAGCLAGLPFPLTLTEQRVGTWGVMQPTGDPWADSKGRIIERVAGSPWLGREWCLRANQGRGPLWRAFFHMYADEALQRTAEALGVFWQRPDLTHLHQHWGRPRPGEAMGQHDRMPEFLKRANSEQEWRRSKAEFQRLEAGGFKECFPK